MNISTPILALALETTVPSSVAGVPGAPDLFSSAVRMVSALAITLGILFLIFYLLRGFFSKRGGPLGSRGLIRVISTSYLGSKRSVVLADVAGEKLVLGLSPQAITLLAKLDSQEALERIAATERGLQTGKPFLWYLESLMAKRLGKKEGAGVEE